MNKPLKPGILEKMNGGRQNNSPAPTTKIGQARKPSRIPPPTARMSRLPARASTPNRIRVTPNTREVLIRNILYLFRRKIQYINLRRSIAVFILSGGIYVQVR
jgi:hypothetical protein